ncbi:hypothetical protein FC15_GL001544 [Lapidilactobacillus concavus DSM 17758]|uniref:ABC transporter domain-containing protein n=1 Tax=Lapidilactobacillus concavus DSM 17758 TaxID=1423735 RepID=A0A0R1W3I8_9LACO|nr:hypothetical protein [Lapidilactobacillus concavus]KRM09971.1 hypothetical protein FC15_GL001544 [Lapidilactobacillus concavus DSM 17758]GEL13554.1 hypothetical protein LCO01nite_11030 [Lapidilactobacillus concavus]
MGDAFYLATNIAAAQRVVMIASHDLTELARESQANFFLHQHQFIYDQNDQDTDLDLRYQQLFE